MAVKDCVEEEGEYRLSPSSTVLWLGCVGVDAQLLLVSTTSAVSMAGSKLLLRSAVTLLQQQLLGCWRQVLFHESLTSAKNQ